MEAVIPRVKVIESMGYEVSAELIEGYVQIILEFEQDIECPRWGTYDERLKIVESKIHSKENRRKVEKEIDSILKEFGMSRKGFNKIKGIMLVGSPNC